MCYFSMIMVKRRSLTAPLRRLRILSLASGFFLLSELIPAVTVASSPLSAPTPEDATFSKNPPLSLKVAIDPEIKELMASSPSPAELSDDAVIFLLKEEKDILNLDGTGELQFHELSKVLKEAGKALSQVRLPYDQSREELEIVLARTIKPDGRIINIDTALVQDVAALGKIPIFSDRRIREFVLPDVSVGDFLELKFIIRIKKPLVKGVFTTYFTYPLGKTTLRSRLIISLPSNMKCNYAVTLPDSREPTVIPKGDRTIYQWAPGPIVLSRGHEPAIPPSFDVDPFVFFSTMESWQQLTEWYVPLFEKNLKNGHEVIQTKVDQLIAGMKGEREKIIKTLAKYVSQQIEYISISLGDSSWVPYPPDYVLNNRYADCKGKAALLIAMLRLVGIDAYGVLVKPSDLGRLIKEVPALDFAHMIVALPKSEGGGYLYVDPTIPLAPYDYLDPFEENRDVIILDRTEPHFEKTPAFPIESSNSIYTNQRVKLASDGSAEIEELSRHVGFRGIGLRVRLRNINPAIFRDLLEETIRGRYPQSQLESHQVSDLENVEEPLSTTLRAKIFNLAQLAGNMMMIDQLQTIDPGLVSLVTYDQRMYPLFLGFGESNTEEGTMILPEGYRPKFLPQDLVIQKTFGSYKRHYEFADGKLTAQAKFVVNLPLIPLELYPEFKAFIEKVSAAEKEKIIFEKEALAAASSAGPTV